MVRVFSKTIYFLNILYLCLIPTAAYIVQGGGNIPDNEALKWTLLVGQFLFGIIILAIIAQSIKESDSLWINLYLFLSGPAIATVVTFILGDDWQMIFYNNYLFEGSCFLLFFFISYFKNRKKGLKSHGKANVYFLAPILFGLLFAGFFTTISFEFFRATYGGWMDYLGLIISLVVFFIGYQKTLERMNEEATDEDGNPDMNKEMSSLAAIPMLIGMLLWFGRNGLLDADWLTKILQ